MRILVAFDGSAGALAALEMAGRLARSDGGQVIALRVLNPLVDATSVVAPTAAEAVAEAARRERERLAPLVDSAAGLEGLDVDLLVEMHARGEDVPEHLVRAAREHNADLIAIASRRAAGVKGLVLGSVTQHVLRLSERPVLVVRPA